MILVDIYIPSVDDTYDFWVEEDASVAKVMDNVIEMIAKKINSGTIQEKDQFLLLSMKTKRILPGDYTLHQSGIRDGDTLMLV
ncbi:MAG: EsaB/YukD family protein [Lachnospiraceae bacterium]|nr:EsaB/YukD family protein [Lachnospiraceae bacterium]